MKTLSTKKLAETVTNLRKQKGLNQEELGNQTGINRVIIGRIEREDFMPSIVQLEALANVLEFDLTDMFIEKDNSPNDFTLFLSQTLTNAEKEGLEKLFQMMLTLRQQITLRNHFEIETNI